MKNDFIINSQQIRSNYHIYFLLTTAVNHLQKFKKAWKEWISLANHEYFTMPLYLIPPEW